MLFGFSVWALFRSLWNDKCLIWHECMSSQRASVRYCSKILHDVYYSQMLWNIPKSFVMVLQTCYSQSLSIVKQSCHRGQDPAHLNPKCLKRTSQGTGWRTHKECHLRWLDLQWCHELTYILFYMLLLLSLSLLDQISSLFTLNPVEPLFVSPIPRLVAFSEPLPLLYHGVATSYVIDLSLFIDWI